MNKQSHRTRIPGCLWLAIVWIQAAAAFGQEPPTPGPEHEDLKRREGEWIATVKTGGGESKGTMTYRMECGGLWLISDFRGEFGGEKFQGRGMETYDPQKKKYVSVWADSMSSRPMLSEGEMDKDKKVLTMIGEGMGPEGKPVKFKSVTRRIDADHESFKMFTVGSDGAEVELVSILYARKK